MRTHTLPIADVYAEAEHHVNRVGLVLDDERSAEALCGYLRSLGVTADPVELGSAVRFEARNAAAVSRIHFALVCWLASVNYRNESAWWVEYARYGETRERR